MEDEKDRLSWYDLKGERQVREWEMEICPACGGRGMMCKCWVDALIDHCEKPDAEKEDIRAALLAQDGSGPFIRKLGQSRYRYPYEGRDAAGFSMITYLNKPPATLSKVKEAFVELMEVCRIELKKKLKVD
ncbi:MAG: hypothetical protein NTV33_03205 [Coprothermobacterota bacterium]|nr:hypothetical protein [Coprothermobacterota bacterium]